MPDLSSIDWVSLGITLAVLAVIWVVVRAVFKFTVRVFACGCALIGGLALGIFVVITYLA